MSASSIVFRSLAFTLSVVLATALSLSAVLYVFEQRSAEAARREAVREAAEALAWAWAERTVEPGASGEAGKGALRDVGAVYERDAEFAWLGRNPEGGWRVVAGNASDGAVREAAESGAMDRAAAGEAVCWDRREEAGDGRVRWLTVVVPARMDGGGVAGVVLFRDDFLPAPVDLSAFAARAGTGIVLAVLLASGVGWWTARRLTREIGRIMEGIDQVTQGWYEYRIQVRRADEIGQAQNGFNLLAQCLERARDKDAEAMRELLAAKRASEAATAAKTDFLANMSHEIRTPMNGIIGTTSLLLESGPTPRQKDLLKIIRASGQSLLHLLNDVLDYSKLESAKMVLDERPVDLRELFAEVGEMFAPLAVERDLELIPEVEPEVPRMLFADRGRLKQILVNLVGNALKFTERGEVRLTAAVLRPGTSDQALRVVVEDTGIGIPEDKLESIFEAFQQADVTTTRKFGGSGLGLAICRKLSSLMGGTITVRSEVDRGSAFCLEFPFRTVPGAGTEDAGEVRWREVIGGRRIAVIGRGRVGGLLERRLAGWGACPVRAQGLDPASMRVVADGEPEVVVVETRCAGAEELEPFLDRLAEARFPVVVVCRLGDEMAVEERGAFRVTKPVVDRDLADQVAAALSGGLPGAGRSQGPGTAREEEPPVRERPARILLVEDQPLNQKIMSMMLEKLGCEVALAGNGQEAVEAVERGGAFDLVLMDLQMPVMGGIEATLRIRGNFRLARQPVIVAVTGHALTGVREECRKAGMNDFLTKPLSLDDLRECLRRQLPEGALPRAA
jgi:signal transduction histidine kinase/CheY-like chemotaxis protein